MYVAAVAGVCSVLLGFVVYCWGFLWAVGVSSGLLWAVVPCRCMLVGIAGDANA